ncbi:MAG: hypothetical protein WD249_00020 [Gaiellaceae bacterium]
MVVRYTRKLLDLLGKGVITPTAPSATDEDWCANLLWIDRSAFESKAVVSRRQRQRRGAKTDSFTGPAFVDGYKKGV